MPKHNFSLIIDRSTLYATWVTHVQGVVLRRFRGCGHFRLRDKDGGHTIRSAISENPMLYANFTALSSTEPELLLIDFLHFGNRNFAYFWEKNNEKYNISHSYGKTDADSPRYIVAQNSNGQEYDKRKFNHNDSLTLLLYVYIKHFKKLSYRRDSVRSAIITPFKVIHGHQFWYQLKAHNDATTPSMINADLHRISHRLQVIADIGQIVLSIGGASL